MAAAIDRARDGACLAERYYAEAMLKVVAEQNRAGEKRDRRAEAVVSRRARQPADVIRRLRHARRAGRQAAKLRRRVLVGTTTSRAGWARAPNAAARGSAGHGDGAPRRGNPGPDLLHPPRSPVLAKAGGDRRRRSEDSGRRASTPDWSVEVAYQQRGPLFFEHVSVGVSVPLPWDRGTPGTARSRRSSRWRAVRARRGGNAAHMPPS